MRNPWIRWSLLLVALWGCTGTTSPANWGDEGVVVVARDLPAGSDVRPATDTPVDTRSADAKDIAAAEPDEGADPTPLADLATADPGGSPDPGARDEPGTREDPGTPLDPGPVDPGTADPVAPDPGLDAPWPVDPGKEDRGREDPGTEDSGWTDPGSPDPGLADPVPGASLSFLSPGAVCTNPCTFAVETTGPIASITYSAEDRWPLGTSNDPAGGFPITYEFNSLGDRWVRARGFDATGNELASADHAFQILAPPTVSRLGAWLWYIDGTDLTHVELATRLAGMGVRRIFVKVADGTSLWEEASDDTLPPVYQAAGLEVFAWSYNYPGNASAQASALSAAASAGYDGYVLDLEVEFDGQVQTLRAVLAAFFEARESAVANRTIPDGWPLYATTWGNPGDHDMHVEVIDEYVDAHLPQTYIEKWGPPYLSDAASTVRDGTCEYRSLGAGKPVHHIISHEDGRVTTAGFDAFIRASGPETSLWRIPGGGIPTTFWDDWEAIDWRTTTFDDEPACP